MVNAVKAMMGLIILVIAIVFGSVTVRNSLKDVAGAEQWVP